MQTERLTIMIEPKYKATVAKQAAARGVSTSEHVRNALDSFNDISGEEEAELATLVAQVNDAVPKMQASLERMIARLEESNRKNDEFLRKMGVR